MDETQHMHPDGPVDVSVGQGEAGGGSEQAEGPKIPENLPLLPMKDMSMFPRMVLPLVVTDPRHVRMIDEVLASGEKVIGLIATRGDKPSTEVKSSKDLYEVGVAAIIVRMAKHEDGSLRLMAQGVTRFRLLELVRTEPYLVGRVKAVADIVSQDMETLALVSNLKGLFKRMLELAQHLPDELGPLAASLDEPGAFCDLVASTLNLSPEERQSILQELDVRERLRRVTTLINREIQILELGSKIQNQIKEGLNKSQREYFLRQQLKAIQKELGEYEEEANPELAELRRRLEAKRLPDYVREEAEMELKRLAQMPPAASEYHVITTYLDWILSLPWLEETRDRLDIARARAILEADHYGLEKVKRRILEYLAVRKLNPDMKGPILCFVGPPGVGKTSLGRSIARALGRKFVRISLGGVRDEAEIRGHRRTYVGALPGRIIQSLRRAGSRNPVFMLDEIDKLGADFRGDPASALLEVLDPEQNHAFSDHYLDLPFDLSKVMFITTANVLDTIPPPLRDRMEVLELPGYTDEEKLKIAKRYLVPRQRREHGLDAKRLRISEGAIKLLISGYTREAGLRNLEREIGAVCRWAARKIAEGEASSVRVRRKDIAEILGPVKYQREVALRTAVAGVATGLAWTPTGGEILFVEATIMPGKSRLIITGQLGDVMKESAQTAVSYVRANAERFGIDPGFYEDKDIHLHVPAGAIPKDGPSAGVTMLTALVSLLTGRAVRPEVAMTGEITLRGLVLPVGGIKEKVLAAHRAGITTVIMPARNRRDLEDVPEQVREELKFIFAERMDQVVRHALTPKSRS